MFDIGNVPFSQVSDTEKKTYEGNVKGTGTYQGYKLRQYWVCQWFLYAEHSHLRSLISTLKAGCETRSSNTTVRAYSGTS